MTGSSSDAVTVPTSAVTRAGTRAFVQVLTGTSDGHPSLVTVGVVGNRVTSLTAGLKAGQQVVLADLDAALPSSTSTTGSRRLRHGWLRWHRRSSGRGRSGPLTYGCTPWTISAW